jgi:SAM-dependent methyltransferase
MNLVACHRRETCRLCESSNLVLVLNLSPTPPANAFVKKAAIREQQASFPLDVFFCKTCKHVQLLDVIDPSILFENYVYVSGTSPSFVKHFDEYASALINRFSPKLGSLIVDIGSNDGTLLSAFQKKGMKGLGVDPARDISAQATKSGVKTISDFFSINLANEIKSEWGEATIITANNVFAHSDDLKGIADGIRNLLAPNGVFAFEVSYLGDVVRDTLFDTIYHEHLAYHSVGPLKKFFSDRGLQLFSVENVASHGGSIRGMVGLERGVHSPDGSVDAIITKEKKSGLDRIETFEDFNNSINTLGHQLKSLIQKIKTEGKSIAGFGAPAKSTTLMYNFGLGSEEIDFIVDDSQLKQGLFSPGTHIPVLSPDALYDRQPDYVIILAWNFAESIMEKHYSFLEGGGCFIVPLPELKIIEIPT